MLTYSDKRPSTGQFWNLYLTTGWNDEYGLAPEDIEEALSASRFTVSAYDDGALVGFGRVVTDGVMHAMVYDLIVAPDRQGCGIGGAILSMLVARCRHAQIPDIQLFCARGKRGFYERRGFVARPEEAPGMEYRP
jgi:GNAT superfamily N-acetyltransferase